tara:strand:+ start:16710 stop:17525 length:816 start_codon:yes stop_codon:yes gene_type:complete
MGVLTNIEITGFIARNMSDDRLLGVVCYVLSAIVLVLRHSADTNIALLSVKIYLTPNKKTGKRGTQLGATNINSGYCEITGERREIVIYREEEWFKVLLHELLHATSCGPPAVEEAAFTRFIRRQFNITGVSLEEGYVEFWARIINMCYAEQRVGNVAESISSEVEYSKEMSRKLLAWYPDYCNNGVWLVRNNNVFSYYVLASAFLRDWTSLLAVGTSNGTLALNYHQEYTTSVKKSLRKLVNLDCKQLSVSGGKSLGRISLRMSLSDAIV